MNNNPLAVPQREKSGSTTFSKYEYQYHWALCKVIDSQMDNGEYALFMELHEDVVIANSLDVNIARFEFNQVKNISTPKYNIDNITKIKKGEKNSVIGKLIQSASDKAFSTKIDHINLVASCNFDLGLNSELELEIITIGDLHQDSIDKLKAAVLSEIGNSELPANIRFIVPKLHIQEQQGQVIGKVAELVEYLFPNSYCNSVNIYRALIDELHRKGCVTYDYTKWDELLNNKALTSEKVIRTIQTHTSVHGNEQIMRDFNSIASELDLNFLAKKPLQNCFERICMERITPSSLAIAVKREIEAALEEAGFGVKSDIKLLISDVENLLSDSIKNKIGSIHEIKATIIYEIITSKT
jgi:hypothetical protein